MSITPQYTEKTISTDTFPDEYRTSSETREPEPPLKSNGDLQAAPMAESKSAPEHPDEEAEYISGWKLILTTGIVALASFTMLLDTSIVVTVSYTVLASLRKY